MKSKISPPSLNLITLLVFAAASFATVSAQVVIDFKSFPDSTPIPNETILNDQFESQGVRFDSPYSDAPRVITALDGILISGGPTGFWGDTYIELIKPARSIEISMIGSAVHLIGIATYYSSDGAIIGSVKKDSYFSSGELIPIPSPSLPEGIGISRVIFNGGLAGGLPFGGAGSIGQITFTSVPEPGSIGILTGLLLVVLQLRRVCREA